MKPDASQCPLCHRPNRCQMMETTPHKGPCWCASVSIPKELLARVPEELRNQACICPACVAEYHRQNSPVQCSGLDAVQASESGTDGGTLS